MTDGNDQTDAPTTDEGAPLITRGRPAPFRAIDLLDSKSWIPLLVIFALGCTLRLNEFNAFWVNPDEGIYFSMVTWESWGRFWGECSGNAHPPLYYLLLRAAAWFSVDMGALRVISLVSGAAWMPAVFLLARECAGCGARGGATGLTAALLIAVAPGAVLFSGLMRPYAFEIALLSFGLFYLTVYLERGARRGLPLYAACMFLALLTHYSTILLLGGVAVSLIVMLLCRRLSRKQIKQLLLWNAPLLATVAVLYWAHLRHLQNSVVAVHALQGWLMPFLHGGATDAFGRFAGFLGALFGGRAPWFPGSVMLGLQGPTFVLFVIGTGLAIWQRRSLIFLLPLCSWATAALLAYIGKYPFGGSRHSLYLTAPAVLPIAYAIGCGLVASRGKTPSRVIAAVTVLALVGLFFGRSAVSAWAVPRNTPVKFAPETGVSRELMKQRADPILEQLKGSPGLILMNQQTFRMLIPLYHRERQDAIDWPTGGNTIIKSFQWGRRTIVVMFGEWLFSLHDQHLHERMHLFNSIRAIDEGMPHLRLGESRNTVLFLSQSPFVRTLTDLGERHQLLGARMHMPSLHMVEYDIARFRLVMAERIRQLAETPNKSKDSKMGQEKKGR